MKRLALTTGLTFALVCSSASAMRLAPGLYDGHPPRGIVSVNNTLTTPQGRSRAIVMFVRGGGWVAVGPSAMNPLPVKWFVGHGYTVYSVDYRAGYDSLADVVAAYDHLRSIVGNKIGRAFTN